MSAVHHSQWTALGKAHLEAHQFANSATHDDSFYSPNRTADASAEYTA
jgi:hypothetical protein